jgi:hypothetical protein
MQMECDRSHAKSKRAANAAGFEIWILRGRVRVEGGVYGRESKTRQGLILQNSGQFGSQQKKSCNRRRRHKRTFATLKNYPALNAARTIPDYA